MMGQTQRTVNNTPCGSNARGGREENRERKKVKRGKKRKIKTKRVKETSNINTSISPLNITRKVENNTKAKTKSHIQLALG